jgi:tRNA threonylcarbamoyladenosine biosynthesis protein TsaB
MDCELAGKPARRYGWRMPAATTLIIETSTPRASMLLAVAGEILAEKAFVSDRSHNAVLFDPLRELLELPAARNLALVLVGSGPGSYSGTRVGIAAAQGLALVRDCPAVAVPSILAVPSAASQSGCLAIGDARRGSFWTARIRARTLIWEPSLTDASGLNETVSAAANEGAAIVTFEDPARFPISAARNAMRQEFPVAAGLLEAWSGADEATRTAWSARIPQPLYLKPPHITAAKRPWLVR